MKWLLAIVVAVTLTAMVIWQRHSGKSNYVNGLAPYNTGIRNRAFILESDCYIFKFKDRETSWPLIGSSLTVPELPAEVKESNIGGNFPAVRIIGVLHIGDHFKIVSVRKDETPTGSIVSFEVLLENETTRPYPRLDAVWIMDHTNEKTGGVPTIMTAYAAPLDKE